MPPVAYRLSFPCPECGGVLTMSVKACEGNCPLCQCPITVNLDVQVSEAKAQEPVTKKGWDNRAFRRPATTTKPMWQPLHQPAE